MPPCWCQISAPQQLKGLEVLLLLPYLELWLAPLLTGCKDFPVFWQLRNAVLYDPFPASRGSVFLPSATCFNNSNQSISLYCSKWGLNGESHVFLSWVYSPRIELGGNLVQPPFCLWQIDNSCNELAECLMITWEAGGKVKKQSVRRSRGQWRECVREREKNWETESPDVGKNEMIHKIERQKASERDVEAERRKKNPHKTTRWFDNSTSYWFVLLWSWNYFSKSIDGGPTQPGPQNPWLVGLKITKNRTKTKEQQH